MKFVSFSISIIASAIAGTSSVAAFSSCNSIAPRFQDTRINGNSIIRSPTHLFEGNANNNNNNNNNNGSSNSNHESEDQDFTEFQQPTSSSSSEDDFMSSLRSRVAQVENHSTKLPLMILDTMLPRQVLQIQIQHPTLKSLMRHRFQQEVPTLGMLGMARLNLPGAAGSQTVPLRSGVEVEIIQMEKATTVKKNINNTNDDAELGGQEEGWDISLRAGRRFMIEGEVEKTSEGWTEARVQFLDSLQEEEEEVQQFSRNPSSSGGGSSSEGVGGGSDRMSVARAIAKSKQFTDPNMNMRDGASLVGRWIELAKENERHPGQIDALLEQLGEIPPEHEPTERALWVGALINPLPALGVAMEIRPKLLVSRHAEERVQVALDGILKSIKHMDGSERMW